jgi:hypothetical protein
MFVHLDSARVVDPLNPIFLFALATTFGPLLVTTFIFPLER